MCLLYSSELHTVQFLVCICTIICLVSSGKISIFSLPNIICSWPFFSLEWEHCTLFLYMTSSITWNWTVWPILVLTKLDFIDLIGNDNREATCSRKQTYVVHCSNLWKHSCFCIGSHTIIYSIWGYLARITAQVFHRGIQNCKLFAPYTDFKGLWNITQISEDIYAPIM